MIYNVILFAAGALIGSKLPDVDLAPVLFVRHRSVFTHGPLLPALAWWAAERWPELAPAASGMLLALCLHLLADAAPRSWSGSAMINLAPLGGSWPAWLSWVWIMAGAITAGVMFWVLAGIGDWLHVALY